MTPNHASVMARYNRWMNEKLYAVARSMSDEERKRDRGAFFKSIHGTLNHILLADVMWLARFTGDSSASERLGIRSLDQELFADFDALALERAATDQAIASFVAPLDAARLEAPLRYTRRGHDYEHPLWWALAHFFNHQTHHRGQITTLFMQAGHDPGVTDLIAMMRDGA